MIRDTKIDQINATILCKFGIFTYHIETWNEVIVLNCTQGKHHYKMVEVESSLTFPFIVELLSIQL